MQNNSVEHLLLYQVQPRLRNSIPPTVPRRSTGERRNDPMHPKAQLNGSYRAQSLDEPLGAEEGSDEPLTLGETLAARTEDPGIAATRRLDWVGLVAALDRTAAEVLCCLIAGVELTELAPS